MHFDLRKLKKNIRIKESGDFIQSNSKNQMNSNSIFNYLKLTRLHQPIGILLLFLPCLFGLILALKELPDLPKSLTLYYIILFSIGSTLMRSAGCIINDLLDYKFDQKVARTKNRPLALGTISKLSAYILLAVLLSGALVILLQFNQKTIISGIFALALVVTYPLMKRFTYYPQIFLGLTFNFGILMASLALLEKITLPALVLYFTTIIWTVIYDTIYAFQDLEDDLKIGVKSTAIKFSNNPKKILVILSLSMFLGFIYLGYLANFKPGFFITILLASFLLDAKISKCNLENPADCLKTFKANFWVGLLFLLAIILG
jgi:4-hydroxybenzoate polyprenyltransferase